MLETGPTDLSFRVLLRECSRRREEALDEIRERIAGLLAIGLVAAVPLLGIASNSDFSLVEQSEAAEAIGGMTVLEPPQIDFDAVLNRIETNQLTPSDIRGVQAQLKRKGFDPGPIDGIAGKHTLSALNAYRRSIRLTPALVVSRESVSALQSR